MVFFFFLILEYKPKKFWAKILFNSNIIVKEKKRKTHSKLEGMLGLS